MHSYDLDGIIVTPQRLPSLDEIAAIKFSRDAMGRPNGLDHDVLKGLCKKLLSSADFTAIEDQVPAAFESLGQFILADCGFGASGAILDEDEITSEAMAAAYVDASAKAAKAFSAANDRRAKLLAVVVNEPTPYACIIRIPRARAIDDVKRSKTGSAMEAFFDSLLVWSDQADIKARAPGYVFAISDLAMMRAGAWSARRVGES